MTQEELKYLRRSLAYRALRYSGVDMETARAKVLETRARTINFNNNLSIC